MNARALPLAGGGAAAAGLAGCGFLSLRELVSLLRGLDDGPATSALAGAGAGAALLRAAARPAAGAAPLRLLPGALAGAAVAGGLHLAAQAYHSERLWAAVVRLAARESVGGSEPPLALSSAQSLSQDASAVWQYSPLTKLSDEQVAAYERQRAARLALLHEPRAPAAAAASKP